MTILVYPFIFLKCVSLGHRAGDVAHGRFYGFLDLDTPNDVRVVLPQSILLIVRLENLMNVIAM